MEAQCIAYTEDGKVCRRPADHIDVQRGGMVCELHVSEERDMRPSEDARGSNPTTEA
jgi:hypothetical protein